MISILDGIPERDEIAIPFLRDNPSKLLGVLGGWWEQAVECTRDIADDGDGAPMKGFFRAARMLVLYCDSELRTINAEPIQEIANQIWAWQTKIICPKCKDKCTFYGDKCTGCFTVYPGSNPGWADSQTMFRTLDRAQAVKERIWQVADLEYRRQREATQNRTTRKRNLTPTKEVALQLYNAELVDGANEERRTRAVENWNRSQRDRTKHVKRSSVVTQIGRYRQNPPDSI